MELNNEFRVAVPAAKTWEVLTDVERVAPCLPGATLLSVDGDEFTGAVKVKVGPITVSYKGVATYQEKDAAAQRIVLRAEGKETRGNGTAAALVTAQLKDEGDSTNVVITTDLAISGKAAQFGRGVLADVSGNLIAQFARSLEAELLGGSTPAATPPENGSAAPRLAAATDRDPLKVVALPVAKVRAGVLAAAAAGVWLRLGRRRNAGPTRARCWPRTSRPHCRGCCREGRPVRLHRPDTVEDAGLLGEYGDVSEDPRRWAEPGAHAGERLDHLREPVDIPRRRVEEHRPSRRRGSAQPRLICSLAWMMKGRVGSAADALDTAHRALPDTYCGTLGGAIAHADPAAEYAAGAALDAIEATRRVRRQIPAAEFFTGCGRPRCPDEILTAVGFPVWSGRCGFGAEFARRHGDFAIAGATVCRTDDGTTSPAVGSDCSALITPKRGTPAETRSPATGHRHHRRGTWPAGDVGARGCPRRLVGSASTGHPGRHHHGGAGLGRVITEALSMHNCRLVSSTAATEPLSNHALRSQTSCGRSGADGHPSWLRTRRVGACTVLLDGQAVRPPDLCVRSMGRR